MNRLSTRAANKDKHPGVVDLSPKRRTHEQKKADDEKAEEDKQAREETRKAGIRKVAAVEERNRQRLNTLMGPGPGPRSRARPVFGSNMAATTRMGTGAEKPGLPVPNDKVIREAIPAEQRVGGNNAVNTGSNIDGEEEKQGKVKKTRVERALYRQEVEAEKTQGQSVAGNEDDKSVLDLPTPHYPRKPNTVSNEKDGISGPHTVRRVQSWMSTIQAPGQPLQTWEGPGSSQSRVTIANTEFTTSSGRQTKPMLSSDDGLRYRMSSEPNEGEYRDALANLPKRSDRFPSMDIIEVISNQRDSPASIGSFASNKATENLPAFSSESLNENHDIDGADVDMYPPPSHGYYDNDDDDNTDQGRYILATPEDAQLGLLSTSLMSTDALTGAAAQTIRKREITQTKMENWPAMLGAPRAVKSESSKKITNKDLPPDAHPAFRRDVVPTIWHWVGGNVHDPFNIDESELVEALAVIWSHVYIDVPFEIPTTVSLINQRFSEWRNSFTSAATSTIISLFSSDDHYLQYNARVAFAVDMMQSYRFLFSDSFSDNDKEWTGMWRGPLFLQVFASHLNATTSRVIVTELDSETQGYEGAMGLAAAALERTLTLLANGEIDIKLVIEDKVSTGIKRKRKATKTAVWKVEQCNGPPQPFSDGLWGGATREFMSLLGQVPRNAMETILYDARLVATNQKARTSKATAPSENEQLFSERAALAFR
ncbi:hypothetical protein EDB83DRAFT_2517683 [Lactarius deliciosus]|nr:hypothetical protein EDB83DRAFT_2517683 [Lactarius deliciosus]